MIDMESGRSGGGGVVKKKSSSGCLIIKEKIGDKKNLDGGLGEKRARLVASSSNSSSSSGSSGEEEDESLEFMRRKLNEKRLRNGGRECDGSDAGMEISGERKRSRLDLFEFDEYDEFDETKMRSDDCEEDRFKLVRRSSGGGNGNGKGFGVGSKRRKNLVVDKRGSSSIKSKGSENDDDDDEAHMPISLLKLKYQEESTDDEPIRLQGKNGVLKVTDNKKKKNSELPSQRKNYDSMNVEERKASKYDDVGKKELLESFVEKEKGAVKLDKVSKTRDKEIGGADSVLKLAPPCQQACSSKKRVKKEEGRTEEGKSKRRGSTEKQMLRDKIRGMLTDAGWTIDLRPRRNRDYLDSVYISPSGTAYWSIVKAYDAFKKLSEEDHNDENKSDVGFAPIAENMINKLTRQTKKRIEREMRSKRKEDFMTKSAPRSAESSDSDQSDERLSSFMKQKCKSRRGKLCDEDQKSDDDDDLSDDSPKRKKNAKVRVEKPYSDVKSNVDQESDDDDLSDDSPKRKKPMKTRFEKPSTYAKSNGIQGKTSKTIGRCGLLVRGSDKGENSDCSNGKRTILAWLIDSGTAKLSEKVQYMNRKRTRVLLEGWLTREGIHCGCCSKILAVSKFELHAGSKLRQAFQNIVLESGSSLLQCQIDAWKKQDESVFGGFLTVDVRDGDDPDDDTCGICGDGGDLICCDDCPSTFHQTCLDIKMLPSDDWHCPNCTCKFCGAASGNVTDKNDGSRDELNKCSFCYKKYHKSCSERVCTDVAISSNGASFCELKCQEIYDHLQKILGVKNELEAGFSWSLVQRTDVSDSSHRGFSRRVECNSKLAVALSVMDECFLPVLDRKSGINLIHNVVYNCGSNFNRLNYSGFYTAILERGDEIISAAAIRIHGTRLAEMPFIGTREMYRRKGMCRRLLSAIETELCSLKVEQLIVPAISEHTNTWTSVFGFRELEDTFKREMKSLSMLVFPGTAMLQKQLLKPEISNGVKIISESTKREPQLPDIDSSLEEHSGQANGDSGAPEESKTNKEADPLESDSPAPAIPANDTTEALNASHPDKTDGNNEANATCPVSCEASVQNVPKHTESADNKTDGNNEMPHEVDAKATSPVSCEASVQNVANQKTDDEQTL